MLKARRKEQVEQLKFPEPREGLPEDPRPFIGSQHLIAAAAVQEQLSARCLVAVVGRLGSGKSSVCARAANSRWARQWYLQDEDGHPVHRRFWVDLEDCAPGAETQEHIAQALGRPTFADALARLGNGKRCLLVLDNADRALGAGDESDTLAALVATVDRGASIVVSRRTIDDISVGRNWSDVVELGGLGSDDEAKQLFDQLAPHRGSDLRLPAIIAACDRLPLAVTLVAHVAARSDLDLVRNRSGPEFDRRRGLDFALEALVLTLDPEDRRLWGALSLFPSGLSADDVGDVFTAMADSRERAARLFAVGLAHRCEAGIRIPVALRLDASDADLDDAAVSDLWRRYTTRAQVVVGPVPDLADIARAAGGVGSGADRRGRERPDRGSPVPEGDAGANTWLTHQIATLARLASRPSVPAGSFELAGAALLVHRSGAANDVLDTVLVRLLQRSLGETATNVPTEAQALVAAQAVAALEEQRRLGASVLVATALADLHRRVGNVRGEAEVLCQQGRAERLWARYEEAETHLAEAHQLFEKLGDGVGQGCSLFELGQVSLDRGRLDDAETYLGEALDLFAAHGRSVGEANTNLELVRVDLARSRTDSAEHRLSDALDRYEQAGDKLGFANACLQLGQVELARGQLDRAERRFAGALDGYEQAGDKVGFAHACLQLGQVDLARGRLDSAERRFGGARAGYQLVGDQVGVANASLQLGQIDLARGRWANARLRLLQALEVYEQLGDRIGVANASLQLGQVDLAEGELDEADRRMSAAQWAYDAIGDVAGSANSRHVWAMLRRAQGRRTDALAMFGEAARLYSSIGRTAAAGWSLAGAARASSGRAERVAYAADAVRMLEKAGLGDAAAQLATDLAEPPARPVPAPEVKRMTWPRPPPAPVPATEPWPRIPDRPAPAVTRRKVKATRPFAPPAPQPEPVLEAEPGWEVASALPPVSPPVPPQAPPPAAPPVAPPVPHGPSGEPAGTVAPVAPIDPAAVLAAFGAPERIPDANPAAEDEDEDDDDPDLEWSAHWATGFEALESAPVGEWTSPPAPAPWSEAPGPAPDEQLTLPDDPASLWNNPPTAEAPSADAPKRDDPDAALAPEGEGWPEESSRKPRFRWGRRK